MRLGVLCDRVPLGEPEHPTAGWYLGTLLVMVRAALYHPKPTTRCDPGRRSSCRASPSSLSPSFALANKIARIAFAIRRVCVPKTSSVLVE